MLLDSPLRRLDRPFDYLVSQDLDDSVRLGVRVRVRFGRQRLEGWVVGRTERADHTGALRWLDAVVGREPVFTADSLALIRKVAQHYAGTAADVMRLAIPPRHAGAGAASFDRRNHSSSGNPIIKTKPATYAVTRDHG